MISVMPLLLTSNSIFIECKSLSSCFKCFDRRVCIRLANLILFSTINNYSELKFFLTKKVKKVPDFSTDISQSSTIFSYRLFNSSFVIFLLLSNKKSMRRSLCSMEPVTITIQNNNETAWWTRTRYAHTGMSTHQPYFLFPRPIFPFPLSPFWLCPEAFLYL